MTNEEAIKIIDKGLDIGNQMLFLTVDQAAEAKHMAIKALSQQTEDAISRQAAIDAVAFGITYATGVNMETGEVSYPFAESNHELRKAIHRICELPLVTPKQRTGHWKQISPARIYECDICGQNVMTDDISAYRYCHGCGTKMVEPQESEVSDADSD